MPLWALLLVCATSFFLYAHFSHSRRWSHLPGFHWATSLPVVGHGYRFFLSALVVGKGSSAVIGRRGHIQVVSPKFEN